MRYSANSLQITATRILNGFGCSANESAIVSDHLIRANLSGHDSHGIGMLPMYGQQVEDGNLIANQTPEFLPVAGAICVVDAKRGFGHHMALLALDHAIETATEHNVAVLGLRNSGHISRAGNYSEYCAAKGFVSLHFVNVWGHPPLVAHFGSCEPGFSTNPVSMGIPVNGKAKPMLDMATSTVALGKVRVAYNRGEQIVATGNNIPRGVFNNMLSIVINPTGFDNVHDIEARVEEFYQSIKGGKPADGVTEVLMPGEPEERREADRRQNGIEVDDATIDQLMETGTSFGVDKKELAGILQGI